MTLLLLLMHGDLAHAFWIDNFLVISHCLSSSVTLSGAGRRSQQAAGAVGTSPGASFPLGTSPGTAVRRTQGFSPSAPPQSKWYIQVQP